MRQFPPRYWCAPTRSIGFPFIFSKGNALITMDEPRLLAAVDFIRRTGAKSIQIRYSDDEKPVVWFVVAEFSGNRWEVDAGHEPARAALRLCERLADGGQCNHCGRPTGLEPDSLNTMPLNKLICWYQYDPELKKFRRGCE